MADPKYRQSLRCSECGHGWKRITTKPDSVPDCPKCAKVSRHVPALGDGQVSDDDLQPMAEYDPEIRNIWKCEEVTCGKKFACSQFTADGSGFTPKLCPACGHQGLKFIQTTAPKKVSERGALHNKAIDLTAETTMQNYKLTNLNDDLSAPKLPPRQQAQADSLFSGRKNAAKQTANNAVQQVSGVVSNAALHNPIMDKFLAKSGFELKGKHDTSTLPGYDIIASDTGKRA